MGVASVIVKAMPTKNQKNTTKIHLISCACITKMGYYILKKMKSYIVKITSKRNENTNICQYFLAKQKRFAEKKLHENYYKLPKKRCSLFFNCTV